MWKKILVALDLSPIATIVFDRALNLAKATRSSLILCHVLSFDEEVPIDPILHSAQYPITPEIYQKIIAEHQKQWAAFQKKSLATLEVMKNKAIEENVSTEIIQLFGRPGPIICQQAKKFAVDLIITGSRGLSGLKELFLGSVSNYVIHQASCSVLIVRNSKQ